MEHRQDHHHTFLAVFQQVHVAGPAGIHMHGRRDVAMGQHGALGLAGGAAGILQDRHFLGRVLHRMRGVAAVIGDQVGEADMLVVLGNGGDFLALGERKQQVLGEGQHVGQAADHHLLQPRGADHLGDVRIQRLEVQRDDDVGLAVLDLVAQLALGIERAVIHHSAAGLQDGEEADHVMRRVGQEQADMHARADAELLEAFGGTVDQVGNRRIGIGLAHEVQAGPRREARDGIVQQGPDRPGLEILCPGYPGRIGFFPERCAHYTPPRLRASHCGPETGLFYEPAGLGATWRCVKRIGFIRMGSAAATGLRPAAAAGTLDNKVSNPR